MGKKCSEKSGAAADAAWRAAHPHQYRINVEAHALVCHLRLDPAEAKKYCPDLVDERGMSTVGLGTNADDIMLSMFRKLQGVLTRVRDTPTAKGTRTEKGASLFKLELRFFSRCGCEGGGGGGGADGGLGERGVS
jgi:hypothetical protein